MYCDCILTAMAGVCLDVRLAGGVQRLDGLIRGFRHCLWLRFALTVGAQPPAVQTAAVLPLVLCKCCCHVHLLLAQKARGHQWCELRHHGHASITAAMLLLLLLQGGRRTVSAVAWDGGRIGSWLSAVRVRTAGGGRLGPSGKSRQARTCHVSIVVRQLLQAPVWSRL